MLPPEPASWAWPGVGDGEAERHDRVLCDRPVREAVVGELGEQLVKVSVDLERPLLQAQLDLGEHLLL